MSDKRSVWIRDFLLFCCLFAWITVYGNWCWFTGDEGMSQYIPPFDQNYNRMEQGGLGYEYFNIAKAIYQGRGFSDPFGDPTGPTGWSPPILPYFMSGMLWLSNGSRDGVSLYFFAMQISILSFTGAIVIGIGRRLKATPLAAIALAIVMMPNFDWLFQKTHDCVFQMFWVNLIFLGLWHWRSPPKSKVLIFYWGILGGLCALAGPATGLTWAAATAVVWGIQYWKSVAFVALVSATTVAPWIFYQSVRLEKFVPIKSNAAFEYYQGICVLPNGLVTQASYPLHPYHSSSREGRRYRLVGETAYLQEVASRTRHDSNAQTVEILRKVCCRIMAATIWLHHDIDTDRKRWSFSITRFLAVFPFAGLISMIVVTLRSRIKGLKSKQEICYDKYLQWIFPASLCLVFYLVPYMAISYYERYGVCVTLPRVLLTFWFLLFLKQLFTKATLSTGDLLD